MRVIGTAGHVDHGKSTLVEALTGTHPDRLREEREREMTIVLGFAWFILPGGEEVGIIDVPGHRDFIDHMLSGVAGIDTTLFVIAADEGVMPQTREHLAILDLLSIPQGVIALTKTDLVDDPEWLDLVEADVRDTMTGTVLADAPLIRVSAKTGQGLPELIEAISEALGKCPPRANIGKPRLPVDRVFTMSGFGTVVTGTLSDGELGIGEEVIVLPAGRRARIRGLQTHKRTEERAIPGSRTAINLSGIRVDQIERGDLITRPGDFSPTRRLDVNFRLLPDASQPLKHNMAVKLYIGAAEVVARLRLLGVDLLQPGETGWLQLETESPIIAVRGDRYILRRPSPGETLGGGVVVDPQPKRRHKRFSESIITRLEALIGGEPSDVIMQALLSTGAGTVNEVFSRAGLQDEVAFQALESLINAGQVIVLEGDVISASPKTGRALIAGVDYLDRVSTKMIEELDRYHESNPLRIGIPREELKSRLGVPLGIFNAAVQILVNDKILAEALRREIKGLIGSAPVVLKHGHEINFSPDEQHKVERLLNRFAANPTAPPTIKDCQTEVGEEVYNALVTLGTLEPVSSEVVFRKVDYDKLLEKVIASLKLRDSISVAQMRDELNTSRRYVLAFLEHLDRIGVTIRVGDVRKMKA